MSEKKTVLKSWRQLRWWLRRWLHQSVSCVTHDLAVVKITSSMSPALYLFVEHASTHVFQCIQTRPLLLLGVTRCYTTHFLCPDRGHWSGGHFSLRATHAQRTIFFVSSSTNRPCMGSWLIRYKRKVCSARHSEDRAECSHLIPGSRSCGKVIIPTFAPQRCCTGAQPSKARVRHVHRMLGFCIQVHLLVLRALWSAVVTCFFLVCI